MTEIVPAIPVSSYGNRTEKKVNLLYVDDEPHNLIAFKAAFRRDFNIFLAESASIARKIIEENDIHVILSDQRMPVTTGIEFFESIIDDFPEPIRILITGYTDINAVVDAINRGQVYKYLTKPWSEDDVRIFVRTAYEVFNLRRENAALTTKLIDANKKLEFMARQTILS
jgi:response regulator RpfG family c-di-GMP phosphodiesterase